MPTQYHYKRYELDSQKIVKYALDYNGIVCLKTLLAIFYISVASACVFLWWIETELALCKSSSNFKIYRCILLYYETSK